MRQQPNISHMTVTGASGFLGGWLLRRLRSNHPDATLAGVDPVAPREPVEGVRYGERLPERTDILFHLVGGTNIPRSIDEPWRDLEVNVRGLLDVLEAARVGAVGRVVLSSSSAVYGAAEGVISEDRPPAPLAPYGVSKQSAEQYMLAAWRLRGTDARIARITNAYGPGQRGYVVWDLARRALGGRPPLTIRGDGDEVRDFIHAADVAGGLEMIALRGAAGGVYNIGSGRPVRIIDLAGRIAELAWGSKEAVQPDGAGSAAKVRQFLPDVSRVMALGFRPSMDLEAGLRETVAWIGSQP